ncbi:hypothetical protein [Microcoleus vaginatus]|uniref:hypothetical protein n=1 Tax=Microcoleus vaginatus TaxID=119532 RepID=UPI00168929F3|nr:hypothetical protein [Microcoleus sp. FACHB-84]
MSEVKRSLTEKTNWQDGIDKKFQARLMRPLEKPGLINTSVLAGAIISRSLSRCDRLPLLAQMDRRWSSVTAQSANHLPLVYAHPLPIPDKDGGKVNLSETSSIPKGHRKEVPIIQAKFASGSESNLLHNLPPQSSQLSEVNDRKQTHIPESISETLAESLVYIGSGSRNLDNIGQPNQSPTPINSNSNLEFSNISVNQLPVIQAKLDSTTQSADILSPSRPGKSVSSEQGESTLPLVKFTPDSISEMASPTAPLFGEIMADRVLTNEGYSSTVKVISQATQTRNMLLTPTEELGAKKTDLTERNSQLLVKPNIVPSWKGLDTPLLWSVPPLPSTRTVAANGSQDLVTKQYHPGEKAEHRKATQVAIARTVPHADTNNSASTFSNSSASSAIQVQYSSPTQTSSQTQIDLDSLADKVERKLIRRLAIESERRGQKRWR